MHALRGSVAMVLCSHDVQHSCRYDRSAGALPGAASRAWQRTGQPCTIVLLIAGAASSRNLTQKLGR